MLFSSSLRVVFLLWCTGAPGALWQTNQPLARGTRLCGKWKVDTRNTVVVVSVADPSQIGFDTWKTNLDIQLRITTSLGLSARSRVSLSQQ